MGDDQEADHQVVTFYAVVGQAEKGQDEVMPITNSIKKFLLLMVVAYKGA